MSKRRTGQHVETNNPEEYGHTGLSFRRQYVPRSSKSWWTEARTREEFSQLAQQEAPRMAQSKFSKLEQDATS